MSKVLLTGGSGFIASHILNISLEYGHDVVTTVRSKAKGDKILDAHSDVQKEKLSYVIVEDVAQDGAFDEAVAADPPFEYVIHTASPFHHNFTDPVKHMLDPAIKGTTGILESVKTYAPSVKRVVVTSSFAAIVNRSANPKVYNETSWNPITWEEAIDNPRFTYAGSKVFAEKAAWDFVEKEKPNFDLVVINPPLVFGPVMHYLSSLDSLNTSNQRIRDIIQGVFVDKDLPPTGIYLWTDVRDAALAHVKAIEISEAGGNRFLVTAGNFSNKQLVDVIRETHPGLSSKLPQNPTDDMPADVYGYDNSKASKVLGINFRPLKDSIGDTVTSLVEIGA